MKNFEYAQPRTESEAIELLTARSGHVEVLAGGTDLVGLMKKMVVCPDRVVNISDVAGLKEIQPDEEDGLWIGASVTLDDVLNSPLVDPYPAVKQIIQGINSIQLQAQGTLVGELLRRPTCWYFRDGRGLLAEDGELVTRGDNRYHAILGNRGAAKFVNASRLAPALIALGAEARIVGPGQHDERMVPVEALYRIPEFEGQRENTLVPGQLVSHIRLPADRGFLSAAYEVRQSSGPDMPLATAAVAMHTRRGVVESATVVMGQVAPVPWNSKDASQFLAGKSIDASVADRAGFEAVAAAQPLSHNGYKVRLAQVAVKRAILLAAGIDIGGF